MPLLDNMGFYPKDGRTYQVSIRALRIDYKAGYAYSAGMYLAGEWYRLCDHNHKTELAALDCAAKVLGRWKGLPTR